MIRVLIAGEGANELGNRSVAFEEGERPSGAGVIEALMTKVRPSGWSVRTAMVWKDVHKLVVNEQGRSEAKTIQRLALRARESGCHALIFLRDRDRSIARERAIRDAVETERRDRLCIAGGVPIEMLENWLLALKGEAKAHADPDPVASLRDRHGIPEKQGTAMVQLVRSTNVLEIAADAQSLWRWLRLVATALAVRIPKSWPH